MSRAIKMTASKQKSSSAAIAKVKRLQVSIPMLELVLGARNISVKVGDKENPRDGEKGQTVFDLPLIFKWNNTSQEIPEDGRTTTTSSAVAVNTTVASIRTTFAGREVVCVDPDEEVNVTYKGAFEAFEMVNVYYLYREALYLLFDEYNATYMQMTGSASALVVEIRRVLDGFRITTKVDIHQAIAAGVGAFDKALNLGVVSCVKQSAALEGVEFERVRRLKLDANQIKELRTRSRVCPNTINLYLGLIKRNLQAKKIVYYPISIPIINVPKARYNGVTPPTTEEMTRVENACLARPVVAQHKVDVAILTFIQLQRNQNISLDRYMELKPVCMKPFTAAVSTEYGEIDESIRALQNAILARHSPKSPSK